jgi:hypothetical protein
MMFNPTTSGYSIHDLILALIRAELRSQKLIKGLSETGIVADDFYSGLEPTILKLVGFEEKERDDDLYLSFSAIVDNLTNIEIHVFHQDIKMISMQMYNALLLLKIERMRVHEE